MLLYPTISNYWNSRTQSKAIIDYENMVSEMDTGKLDEMIAAAEEYNRQLARLDFPMTNYTKLKGYEDLLNIEGNGIMGYISIEKIRVELPIYHGTDAAVLNVAAGHLEGTSLPVGGKGTHCVLSAHRGLPSAKLFTDLDEIVEGDIFTITVLNKVLVYQVDQIRIVEPTEVQDLAIDKGEDYCTLMTCTPYGINTHRMLVRGYRIDGTGYQKEKYVSADAYRIDPLIVTPVAAIPMLLVLLVYLLVKYRKKKD